MTDLIALSDLEDRLGQTLDDHTRALAVIADVSAVIRAYTGRPFAATEATDTVTVHCGVATLPHGPVTAVGSVVGSDDTAIEFTWTSGRSVHVEGCASTVEITYSYDSDTVPPVIVAVAAQMAGRALGTTPSDAGIQQESLGSYSVTHGSASGSGPLGILPHERAVLDMYRGTPRARSIRLSSWA